MDKKRAYNFVKRLVENYESEFEKYSHRTVRNFQKLQKTPSIKRGCPDSLVLKIKHKKNESCL